MIAAGYISEADFQATVIEMAQRYGWKVYYIPDSRRSPGGYPDLTLARNGIIHFWELKAQRGVTSPAQREWMDALGVWANVMRPSDMDEIERLLQGI